MDYLLTTDNLTKQYGRKRVLSGVNLRLPQGDIYGLVGRNGAGKTTLMRIICGLATPSYGSVTFFDKSGEEARQYASRIGALVNAPGVFASLTVLQNLELKCLSAGISHREYARTLLQMTGLADLAKKKVKGLAPHILQRLGIAMALVGNPDLLILDEPAKVLDTQGVADLRELITSLNRDHRLTVLVSGSKLDALSRFATRYGILHQGILLEELTAKELFAMRKERIEIHTSEPARACTVLEEMHILNYKVVDAHTIEVYEHVKDSGAIIVKLVENHVPVAEVSRKNATLEDYYLSLTQEEENYV